MSRTKKMLSVFLSFLMVLSSITVGLTAFAADDIKTYDGLDENHQALAAALQVSYVVDLNNYKQNATRDYVAYDNKDGDIAKAAEAFYNCVASSADTAISESKRYSDIIKAIEATLKAAMEKDYTTNMNKVIGFLCGNGSVPSTSLNYPYKLTVVANMDEILSAYSKASDVPDTVADKATLYTYTQASNVFKSFENQTVAAGMNLFKDFAKIYSSEAMAKNASSLTKTEIDNYVKNGQKILDDAKIISQETISNLLGDTVTFEAAQTYLNQVLVVKSNEYVEAITALGTELDGKELSDYTLTSLKTIKTKLDAAEKLYKAYVDVQKEAVKASHDKYDEYLQFYNDSFNYNTAIDYAKAVADIEKYSQDSYKFTKEELSDVKKLLDAAEKVYKTFKVPVPDSVADDKATYDKALENYNAAVDYYNNLDYYLNLDAFIELLENQSVLDIPKTAEIAKSNYLLIIDDFDGNILKAEKSFINMINMIFANKKASNLAGAVQKISDDLKDKIGIDAFEEKNAAEILNYLYGAPAASSATGTRYVQIEEPYLFKFASIEELLVPDEIKYTSNDFTIRNTSAASEKENSLTDETVQAAFSGFVNLFTDALLNSDIEEYTFDELSLIRRKASIALDNISNYSEKKITHFIESEKYSAAQAFYSHCEEAIEQKFNAMIDAVEEKYGNREVTAEEAKAFFNEAAVIEKAYSQLSEAVKASETVIANMEKLNELKASIKLIVDKADAEEFIEMVKAFEDKYPKKDLSMDIYDAFNADIKPIFDFYGNCSEETRAMEDVVKASEALAELNEAMTEIFRAYRFEVFKKIAPEKLDSWYTGSLENPQIVEFTTFDIAKIKQIIAEINNIYGDLSDEARIDSFVVNYMAVVSMLQERITLLTNPPEFHPYTVEYPDNVTREEVLDIVSRLDDVIAGDLISGLVGKPLDEAVDGLLNGLLTADIVNTLVKALYPMVADALGSNASLAGMLNINVLPKTLAKNIKHYPNVKSALEAAGEDWNAVDWEICDWVNNKGKGVNNLDTFIDALGEALTGVIRLLNTLLNGITLNALVLTIPGNQGYEKDILPLLELLGCDAENGLVSVTEFNAASGDVPQMLRYIINPLLSRVKEILKEKTVSEVLDLIPNLAYVISNDMLNAGFADLVSPLKDQIDLVQTLKDAGIDLTNLIVTINSLLSGTGIKLPVLNWAEFAGIGTFEEGLASMRPSGVRSHINSNIPDVLVQLLYYVADVLAANQDAILGLLGNDISPVIKDIAVKALGNDKKTLAGAVIKLLTPYAAPDYTWPEFKYNKTDVSYSAYTFADVKNLVDKLSSIINNVINLLLDGSLNDLIGQNLYTGDMVQTIFNAVSGILDNETVAMIFSLITITDADGSEIKLDISKDAVADNFKDFSKIAKAIKKADSISKAAIEAADWEIQNEEDFVNAVAAILAPISPVLTVLLAGKGMEISIADGAVKIYGANGYNNAVKPLLDALTCETMEFSEFNAQAAEDSKNAVINIINPLLKLVNKVAADPVHSVMEIIPHAALFIDNNGIQTAVSQLLAPLNNILGAVSVLMGANSAYEWLVDDLLNGVIGIQLNWNKLQNQVVPILNDKVLGNININGKEVSLKLNDIDWGVLAGCLDKDGASFIANTSDTAVTVVDYVWKTVKTNETVIQDLLKSAAGENYETVSPYLEKVFALESDDLIKILVELTKGLDASSFKADWSFLYEGFKKTNVKLPVGVSEADIVKTIQTVSDILNKVIEMLLDGSLNDLVDGALYTDSLITTVAKAVYSLGENSTVNTVLGVLGIDLSKDAIVETLKKDYPTVSKAIKEAESLGSLDTSKWEWNVEDKDTFTEALVTVLRPFAPALDVLLNSGELNIAGVVDFKGSNGYENAVKPLLDALGCKTVSASQYAKDAEKNADNLLLNIVNPLLNLVDEVLANPVEKIAEILPQAANFIDKG
ncbi:MAG: hypothetical protein K2I14_09610, partial [Eubacterium sp.]|nr:hypothetical protein [Eubacterium sp.]